MSEITQQELMCSYHYDPLTGIFTRLTSNNQHRWGYPAGYNHGRGYIKIEINSKAYFAHRLAFLYVTGNFPEGQVDHINQVRDDNRWCNLRDVDRVKNATNLPKYSTNTSGVTGVYWNKNCNKWDAKICINGKLKNLGLFVDKDEAIAARKAAEMTYSFHENHGAQDSTPRKVKGIKYPTVDLSISWEDVCKIREIGGSMLQKDVAKLFNTSQRSISRILNFKTRIER